MENEVLNPTDPIVTEPTDNQGEGNNQNLTPQDGQVEEKPATFDPDNLDLSEGENLGGYDLSKFAETLNLDEEGKANFDRFAKKYQELGITQEQFEGLLNIEMEERAALAAPERVQENLMKNLSYEEKQNYKANCTVLKNALEKTGQSDLYLQLAADPGAMKIVNAVVNALGGGRDVNRVKERETRATNLITATQGIQKFTDFLKSENVTPEMISKKKNEIRATLLNQEEINYFNQIIGQ